MKALKAIGILLIAILGIGLIASLVLPKDIEVSESISINAPVEVVWNSISSWERTDKWSPWYKDDPEMKINFEGETGKVGSTFSWEGNDKVGSGKQTYTFINKDSNVVKSEVVIMKPWEGKGNATIQLISETEGGTKVTWSYVSHVGIPGNLFSTLYNVKGMLSEAYGRGLAQLKDIAEDEYKNLPVEPTFDIVLEEREAASYLGKKEVVGMDTVYDVYFRQLGAIQEACSIAGIERFGLTTGLFFSWDDETGTSEMSAAVKVKITKAPANFELFRLPAGSYLVIDFTGEYDKLGAAHVAIEKYMTSNGFIHNGPAMEEYVNDKSTQSDPSKLRTKVVYAVKRAPTE